MRFPIPRSEELDSPRTSPMARRPRRPGGSRSISTMVTTRIVRKSRLDESTHQGDNEGSDEG